MFLSSKVLQREALVTFMGGRGHKEEAWPYGWSKVGRGWKEAVFFFPCSIIKYQRLRFNCSVSVLLLYFPFPLAQSSVTQTAFHLCPLPLPLGVFCRWSFLQTEMVSPQPFCFLTVLCTRVQTFGVFSSVSFRYQQRNEGNGSIGKVPKGVRIIQVFATLGVWSVVLSSLLKCQLEVPLNSSCVWDTLLSWKDTVHLAFSSHEVFPAPCEAAPGFTRLSGKLCPCQGGSGLQRRRHFFMVFHYPVNLSPKD